MTQIGAGLSLAALAVGKPVAQLPVEAARPWESTAPKPATSPRQGLFSTKELGQIMLALAPVLQDVPDGARTEQMERLLKDMSERRAAGQDVMVVGVKVPGGGSVVTVMSPAELAEALASKDPKSLGSFTTDRGETFSIRDLVRQELERHGEGKALSSRHSMMVAIAEMMEDARNAAEMLPGETLPAALRRPIRVLPDSTATEPKGNAAPRVALLALPAPGSGGNGAAMARGLLDVSV